MELNTQMRGPVLIITPKVERLDALRAPEFREQMIALVDKAPLVVISFSEVQFMDSSGLGSLVAVMKTVTKSGQLHMAEMNWMVRNVFRLTRLDRIFQIYDSVEDALIETGTVKKAA